MGEEGVVFNPQRHEHELHYTEGLGKYKCSGCKGSGGNTGYNCPRCPEFVFHKTCAASPDEIVHSFFPQDPFKFRAEALLRHDCRACGLLIRGFLFESSSGCKVHPLCLDLPLDFRYTGHEHHDDLQLTTNQERGKYRCTKCTKKNKNWKYWCTMVPCQVELDMNCAIIDINRLSQHNISQVYEPSKAKRVLKKVAKAGKSIVVMAGGALFAAAVGEAGSALANRGTVDHDGGEDEEGGSGHGGEGRSGP